MSAVSEQRVIEIVAEALGLDPSQVSLETASSTQVEWDSLGHLDILQRLDSEFPGTVAQNPDIGSAQTVREIYEALTSEQ